MPGVIPLSGLQLGVEATAGTPVATTRELYPSPSGYFDPGLTISRHDGAQRGTYANITHGTILGYMPTVGYASEASHGMTFDELPIIMSQLESGLSGAGTGADKTWSTTAGGTTASFDTYTLNAFDATQCYEVDYGFMTGFSISGGSDDLTQCSMDWVGRTASKVTVDAVAANDAVKIPSGLWAMKYATTQGGLAGASALDNTLRSWTLSVSLPQVPRFYADGTLEFGQGVASNNLSGTLEMTWDSTSDAVTQYDRFVAQSTSFIQLKAVGPSLGGGTYEAQIEVCVLWDPVTPMASESDGVMEYSLTGHLVYDSTWTAALGLDAVCSIASLP